MTPRYLLDTNVVSEAARQKPNPGVMRRLERHKDEFGIASIVWHELVFGCNRLPLSEKRTLLGEFLSDLANSSMPIFPYDAEAAAWHGEERARLTRLGLTPAFADGQIASIAKIHDVILVTNNIRNYRHFDKLKMENWHGASKN
ncbi:MAG TPA: type II toxin-antitoxin system VapC family toxin [Puia sp.]|nr:type II toxin-antitoxin system VapC family toxin [Puia sp.]